MSGKQIEIQDIWFADFPFQEDGSISKKRPVIVLDIIDEEVVEILSIKVTSHLARTEADSHSPRHFEVPLFNWRAANLQVPSIAVIDHMEYLSKENFLFYIGKVDAGDWNNINKRAAEFMAERQGGRL